MDTKHILFLVAQHSMSLELFKLIIWELSIHHMLAMTTFGDFGQSLCVQLGFISTIEFASLELWKSSLKLHLQKLKPCQTFLVGDLAQQVQTNTSLQQWEYKTVKKKDLPIWKVFL